MANILVVGPHPDDQELGMGGAVARFASQGHRVLLLDVTNGEPTPHGSVEVRLREATEAAAFLSPKPPGNPVERRLLDLPNRFVTHMVDTRHKVAGAIRAHQAQIIFVPYPQDAHPDHRAVTRIVEDARFDAKLTGLSMPGDEGAPPIYPKWLFYYFATHLRIVPQPTFCVDISAQLEQKMASVRAYHSQFGINPVNRGILDWVRAQGIYFGSRIGTEAAEPFWTPEPLGLGGLGDLAL
jgi:bacillithiol biosynthesis deacetylase BshB1